MVKKTFERVVSRKMQNTRLDLYLIKGGIGLSRSGAERLIKEGKVTVNGKETKPGYKIKEGDRIYAEFEIKEPYSVVVENFPVPIVYEDDDVIIVNKPKGLVVHPAKGNVTGTLVNALLGRYKNLAGTSDKTRPGIVHRLDKDTTGLMVVAKSEKALISLGRQMEEKSARRTYIAVVWGIISNNSGTVEAPIGRHPIDRKRMAVTPFKSRNAITDFIVLKRFAKIATLLQLNLHTGRTHQIRVHLEYIDHPVVGDPTYSGRDPRKIFHVVPSIFNGEVREILNLIDRQALHAWQLSFFHPGKNQRVSFEVDLPDDMKGLIEYLTAI